jgi:DNA-binding MarR family transcriptional regulator
MGGSRHRRLCRQLPGERPSVVDPTTRWRADGITPAGGALVQSALTMLLIRTILQEEILPRLRQRPFDVTRPQQDAPRRAWRFETVETPEREIYLLLQHISGELIHELATLLKPSGITPEQYHVLRILQDAGSGGTPLSAVAERSPVGDPDVTGLLDRLERRGLARRAREAPDRRVVTARITREGRQLLERLAAPVAALHTRQLGPLGERGLQSLRKLLHQASTVGPVI